MMDCTEAEKALATAVFGDISLAVEGGMSLTQACGVVTALVAAIHCDIKKRADAAEAAAPTE